MIILAFYCLAALIAAGVILYIWLSRKKPEARLEKDMAKSKDNL